MPKYCVEPAHDNIKKKVKDYDWKFTAKKGDAEQIVFPHVDSCLGAVLLLADGTVVAGHVNAFVGGDMNYKAALKTLTDLAGKQAISKAIVFGDVENWQANAKDEFKKLGKTVLPAQGGAKGLDVVADLKTGEVDVAEYADKRDFSKDMKGAKTLKLW